MLSFSPKLFYSMRIPISALVLYVQRKPLLVLPDRFHILCIPFRIYHCDHCFNYSYVCNIQQIIQEIINRWDELSGEMEGILFISKIIFPRLFRDFDHLWVLVFKERFKSAISPKISSRCLYFVKIYQLSRETDYSTSRVNLK